MDLGLNYNLLTKFTSFVAIDTEKRLDNGDSTQKVVQAQPITDGADFGQDLGSFSSNISVQSSRVQSGASMKESALINPLLPAVKRIDSGNSGIISTDKSGNFNLTTKDSNTFSDAETGNQIKIDLSKLQSLIIYPKQAKKEKIEGKVVLRLLIDKNGNLKDISVKQSAHELLADAAKAAIKKYFEKYKVQPAQKNGKPVNVWIEIPLKFKLD